jgi:hypothetical protein
MPLALEEMILSYRDYYGSYHHHKENMAYTATTLYLAGATTLVVNGAAVWNWADEWLVISLLLVSGILGFAFVCWQLYQRAIAADVVMACTSITTTLLTSGKSNKSNLLPKSWHGISVPKILFDELESIAQNRKLLGESRTSAVLTLLALSVWSVAAYLTIACVA